MVNIAGIEEMYQVTASQTEQNIKLISCVKHHRCLYDHSDQNYKNSVYVDKAWQSVSKEFGENIIDCKKKWRHLRSSLSRYLKSSKDHAKNKNNKLKPYYLLQHMDFLVPYTKTLEMKSESVVNKYEASDDNEGFPEMKAEDTSAYDHEIIQEESQSMEEEDEDIVYETYEIQEQIPSTTSAQNTKSQVTLVRSSHLANAQTTSIPQLQPIINTISSMSPSQKPQSQALQLSSTQISQMTQQGQQQQQQSSSGQVVSLQGQQNAVQNTIIPISDDQSADLNFFLALLPDVRNMNQDQKRRLRIGTLKLIDEILGTSPST